MRKIKGFIVFLCIETALWLAFLHYMERPLPQSLTPYAFNIAIATAICAVFWILKAIIQRNRLAGASMKQIDNMTGEEFEQYLGVLYRKKGYSVKFTPSTMDFGADLILKKDNLRLVVQAKRYRYSVGEAAVQQAISGKEYYEADKCAVVTNSNFTNAAQKLAKQCGVTLIDRTMLYKGKVAF